MQRNSSFFSERAGVTILFLGAIALWGWMPAVAAETATEVDFRYTPPAWQTAICLPDDAHKTLVDRSGALLYHYGQGGREFGTVVSLEPAPGSVWERQSLHSARVPIVRTQRTLPGLEIVEEAFAAPGLAASPGTPAPSGRQDLVVCHVRNTGTAEASIAPRLLVDTTLPAKYDAPTERLVIGQRESIRTSLAVAGVGHESSRHNIQLDQLTIPAGQTVSFFVAYCSGDCGSEPATVEQALALRERAVEYWHQLPLPWGCVQVPDAGVQALVESSIRNIWQAREIKQGLPVFQVGPTCYRGLWIVDGAFLLEAAALVGAGQDAQRNRIHTGSAKAIRRVRSAQSPVLQGKRHRALDLRATCDADPGQSVARIRMAQAGGGRRLHPSSPAKEPGKRHAAG